ncbi:MAG: ParB/RepB/Spo0J family partition protein [Fibrobacterota bacterium]
MEKKSRQALHRGLRALISVPEDDGPAFPAPSQGPDHPALDQVLVADIVTNPYQPRVEFAREELDELKASIKKHGVLSPVVLRRSKGRYELVSGERRLRAARELGLPAIPAVVRDKVSDREMQLFSLIENQLRADLNDLEIALGYNELINNFGYTHDKIADDMGKSRPFVSNTLRLLKLPDEIKEALRQKILTSGHARALLSLPNEQKQLSLFKKISVHGLSVRQTEKIIQDEKTDAPVRKKGTANQSFDLQELEKNLSQMLDARVQIQQAGNRGKIIIRFADTADLNRLITLIGKK